MNYLLNIIAPCGWILLFTCVNCLPNLSALPAKLNVFQPVVSLGGNCTDYAECRTAFTACIDGKCQCQLGFEKSNGKCKPQTMKCPFGEPIQTPSKGNKNDDPLKCIVTYSSSSKQCPDKGTSLNCAQDSQRPTPGTGHFVQIPNLGSWNDSCPSGSYCLAHLGRVDFHNNAVYEGFCCPAPQSHCPIGEPLPNHICTSITIPSQTTNSPLDSSSLPPLEICPSDTHYCATVVASGSPFTRDTLCCPKACPLDLIFVDGECVPRKMLGQECSHDVQCSSANAALCKKGKCVCDSGSIQRGNFCYQIFCQGRFNLELPQQDAEGELMRCEASSDCGSDDSYCVKGHMVCCPKPAPFCPTDIFKNVTEPVFCDPGGNGKADKTGNESQRAKCEESKDCLPYFASVENNAGVCCD